MITQLTRHAAVCFAGVLFFALLGVSPAETFSIAVSYFLGGAGILAGEYSRTRSTWRTSQIEMEARK